MSASPVEWLAGLAATVFGGWLFANSRRMNKLNEDIKDLDQRKMDKAEVKEAIDTKLEALMVHQQYQSTTLKELKEAINKLSNLS